MIVYLNGNFVDDNQACISIWDAGFLFGEGVFTTLRLNNGVAADLESHWKRLVVQSAELDISFSTTLQEVQTIVGRLVEKNRVERCAARLRITLTRGGDPDHPMPISPATGQPSTLLLTISPLPRGFDDEIANGIKVITLGPEYGRRCRPDLKSLNFLPSLMALRRARRQFCGEAIMFDDDGIISEAAMSSVFACRSSEIVTPKNNGRILAGCTRQMIMDLARINGLTCREVDLSLKDLKTAQEVFLCNSIREIIPVICIDDQPVGQKSPGPITMQIRQWYRQAMTSP